MPAFGTCPQLVVLDITEETVSKTACQLKGAAGVGGTDSETIASWLLKFGTHSQRLRNAITRLAKWLSNDNLHWAAYLAPSHCTRQKSRSMSHCHRRSMTTTHCTQWCRNFRTPDSVRKSMYLRPDGVLRTVRSSAKAGEMGLVNVVVAAVGFPGSAAAQQCVASLYGPGWQSAVDLMPLR